MELLVTMRIRDLASLLLWAPGSLLLLTTQPSYAAEYTFEFLTDGFVESISDLGAPETPEDDFFSEEFVAGPFILGNGFLSFDDDAIAFGSEQTIPLSSLRPSADFDLSFSVPTGLNTPAVSFESIRTPVLFSFIEDDLVGLTLTAAEVIGGGGARLTVLDVSGDSFDFSAEEYIPPILFEGSAFGSGSIRFEKVDSGQPKAVPEPTTVLGMIAAFGMSVVMKRKFSA